MTKKATPVKQQETVPVENNAAGHAADPVKEIMSISSEEDDPEDKFIARALEVFASHEVNEIYFTSDGTAFVQPQFARLHAENLEDNMVLTVKRKEV